MGLLLANRAVLSPASIIKQNMIGEWSFSGNTNDTSESGNNAQLGDGVTPSTFPTLTNDKKGIPNSAYDYVRSSGQYMELGDVYDIGTGDFSISAWVNLDDITGTQGIVSKSATISVFGRWGLGVDSSNFFGLLNHSLGTEIVTFSASTGWKHLMLIFDRSGDLELYVDNVLKASTDISFLSSDDFQSALITRFGSFNDSLGDPANFINGVIDNIRLYNAVLSQQQKNALFAELS
jgi:hypothetical protein